MEVKCIRTFSEIMIDADDSKSIDELKALGKELFDNKKCYPLIQLWFANERFELLQKKPSLSTERLF